METRKSKVSFGTSTSRNAASRADDGWFVGQVLWEFADGFVLVKTILVYVGFARQDVFAGFDVGLGTRLVEVVRCIKEILSSDLIRSLYVNLRLKRKFKPIEVRVL